ncbi:hypothetical protein ACQ4PT_057926 [Festuca glaucescens]
MTSRRGSSSELARRLTRLKARGQRTRRKPSIWGTYTQQGYALDHATADVAADQYHKYKAYVRLMHEMGLDAYRFSISWPRLIPDGLGAVNQKGLEYYNSLIDELLKHGIQPHTTIYHFDLPQALQDEYNGLLSPRIIEGFTAFADVCFRSIGDRVKQWTTVNEPNMEPLGGYDMGTPSRHGGAHPRSGSPEIPAPRETPRQSRTSSLTTCCSRTPPWCPSIDANTRLCKVDGLGSRCSPGGMSRPQRN